MLQPSLDRLRDALPTSPFAWVEGGVAFRDGAVEARTVAYDDELRGLPLGVAAERLAGAVVLVELVGPPDRATSRWLGGWVSAWGDLSDLLLPDEIVDFPRFVVYGVDLGDPLPGFTRVGVERLVERASRPEAAPGLPEPLPFEHLHPDLQDRLGWLAAVGAPLTTDELARLSGAVESVLVRERATLLRIGYLEPERSDWSLRPEAPVPAEVVLARAQTVRPLLEARYAATGSPALAARLLELALRRGEPLEAGLANAVLLNLLAAGRAAAAAELSQRLLEGGASAPGLVSLAARALRESGDLAGAARLLASASADDEAARLEHARLLLAAGDLPGALARLAGARGLEARLLEGTTLLEAGRGADAERALASLGALPSDTPDGLRAEVDNLRGKIALHLGNRPAALACFDRLCASPLPVMRARGFHNKALLRLAEGDHRRAIDLWQRTHAITSEAGQWYGAALALYNVGVAYEYLGNYGVALRFLRDALAAFRSGGYRSEIALALTGIADLYLTLGRLRGSRAILAAAARLAREQQNSLQELRVALREARLDVEDGDAERAVARLDALEPFLTDQGAPSDRCQALLLLVEARLRQGGGAELKGRLADLLALGPAVLDAEQIGWLRLAAGQLRRDAGEAEAGFLVVERTGNPWAAFRAAGSVADLYRALGDESRHARWREVAEQWLDRFRRRVPGEFAAGLDGRPDVRRHRNLRAGCLLADPKRLEARRAALARSRYAWLVGTSGALLDTLARVEEVALLDPAPVLLRGPAGAGKSGFARALHAVSPRAAGPFVVLPRGAVSGRCLSDAQLSEAEGGTLFVPDATALPDATLATLARLVRAPGSARTAGVRRIADVRVVLGLDDEGSGAGAGLPPVLGLVSGVIELRIPGLAARRSDVPSLVAAFLAELNLRHRTQRSLPDPVQAELSRRAWPGEARALCDEVHRLYWNPEATAQRPGARAGAEPATFPIDLNQVKTDLETRYIREALVKTDANIAAAARLLGMKRPRLSQKIRELDIDLDRLRRQP